MAMDRADFFAPEANCKLRGCTSQKFEAENSSGVEEAEKATVLERDRREDAEERAKKAEARPRLERHHVLALLGAVRDRGEDDDLPEALNLLRAALTQPDPQPEQCGGSGEGR